MKRNIISIAKVSTSLRQMKIILFLIAVLFYCTAFSQIENKISISDDIELKKLSDKIYLYVSYSDMGSFGRVASNGVLLVDNNEAFLFDTPVNDEQTGKLVEYIEDSLKVKIIGFVAGHWHSDCIGGLNYIHGKSIPSYAGNMTIEIAEKHNLPLPKNGFDELLSLKLNDIDIECYYPGAGHSLDNIVVWIPSEKVLFGGCLVKDVNSYGLGNVADGDVEKWSKTIQKVIDKYPDAEIVIPGHGDIGNSELLFHTQKVVSK